MPRAFRDLRSSLSGYPWSPIFVCAAIWAGACFLNALFGMVIPGIIAEFAIPVSTIGLILSASFLVSAMTAGAGGMLADKYGHRPAIAVGLAACAMLTGAIAAMPGLIGIALMRIVGTGFGSAMGPLTGGYVANLLPAGRRPIAMAIVQCGFPAGWALSALFAAPLIAAFGWRAAFWLSFPVALLGLLAFRLRGAADAVNVIAPVPGVIAQRAGILEIYRGSSGRNAFLVASGFFCYAAAYGGSAFYIPAFLQEVRGYSASDATYLVGVTYAVGTAGYIGAAFVGQTLLNRRQTAQLWCLLGTLFFLGFVWLPKETWHDAALFSATAFFFYGTGAVLFSVASEMFPPSIRTTGMALSASLGVNCGFAISPTISGILIETVGWSQAFTMTALPLAITVVCLGAMSAGSELEESAPTGGPPHG